MALHIFSVRLIKTQPKELFGRLAAGLMMETPENVALLIDVVIFLQNNVSLDMLPHPLEDILVRNPTISLFKGIFHVGKQIIPQLFELFEPPL